MSNQKQKKDIVFHEALGKLFYAIAKTDGNLRSEEELQLMSIIENEWQDETNKNGFGKEIINTFINLKDLDADSENCFNEFITFKEGNSSLFNSSISKSIMDTASKIAYSFSSINKSELILLAKLNLALKKTQ